MVQISGGRAQRTSVANSQDRPLLTHRRFIIVATSSRYSRRVSGLLEAERRLMEGLEFDVSSGRDQR